MRSAAVTFCMALLLLGCPEGRPRGGTDAGSGSGDAAVDGGALDARPEDAGGVDAGGEDAGEPDTGGTDAGALDVGAGDAGHEDATPLDAQSSDAEADAGPEDAGEPDTGAPDAGFVDAGPPDSGIFDSGIFDSGIFDSGVVDSGVVDAGPAPVTCNEPGLVTEVIHESASSGTPDSYFRDVTPGDPLCASITGGGSGTWGVYVSNGTSSGIYCANTPDCRVRVRPGDTTLIVTAVTSDIGSYTLTIRRIPP